MAHKGEVKSIFITGPRIRSNFPVLQPFLSLSLCVRTSGQMGSVVSSSSANWHSVFYCPKTVCPDSYGSVRTYMCYVCEDMWHLPIALMAHMSQLQRAVLGVGNCFGKVVIHMFTSLGSRFTRLHVKGGDP